MAYLKTKSIMLLLAAALGIALSCSLDCDKGSGPGAQGEEKPNAGSAGNISVLSPAPALSEGSDGGSGLNLGAPPATDNTEGSGNTEGYEPIGGGTTGGYEASGEGIITLNETGRALFADVFISGGAVWATYQITDGDSLVDGKNLYLKKFDRDLNPTSPQQRVINVDELLTDPEDETNRFSFKGDLGDHKLTLLNGCFYMVMALKGPSAHPAAVLRLNDQFQLIGAPLYIGDESVVPTDMGFCNDGENLYVQMFYQPAGNPDEPDDWAAKIYKIDASLELLLENEVDPDDRPGGATFMTGNSIVFVPKGAMGAREDQLQCFSADAPSGDQGTGIQTFAVRASDLSLIEGSRQTIIKDVNDLDCYFPTRPSWNEEHSIWVVGYTVEPYYGGHPTYELGPSYIQVFDKDWRSRNTVSLNNGADAFRVMTRSAGDDIYVVYDEMAKDGSSVYSDAKIERFKINNLIDG